jgi:DNA-directed RNA polymerase subunit beta'
MPEHKLRVFQNCIKGLITITNVTNQVIDGWTSANAQLTELAMKNIREDQQGFNCV